MADPPGGPADATGERCRAVHLPPGALRYTGRGGMGVAYRGRDDRTGDEVAIKTVVARTPALPQSIRREIHALGGLRHPGLVRVVATGFQDLVPWFAMELLDGQTLDAILAGPPDADRRVRPGRRGPPAHGAGLGRPDRARPAGVPTLVARLCATLAYLNGEGTVHRDVKPSNVFIRPDGSPVLVDFGLAAQLGTDGREALTGGGRRGVVGQRAQAG